jgi:hypothetical protein
VSYSFTVTAKDGKLEVPEEVFHVPDGVFMISGHADTDGKNESISVFRKDAGGSTVASASGWHA